MSSTTHPGPHVDVGIVATDAIGRVTFASPCALAILRRLDPVLGQDVREVMALPLSPAALLGPSLERRWVHWLRAGEETVEIDLVAAAVTQADGRAVGFHFVFHDRTQERQLEMEHRRFERLAAMGTMVAGFAHEIRNPMASLRSIAEALAEELAEANVRLPHVNRMLDVLARVERLVRTSLLFGSPAAPRRGGHAPWRVLADAVSALQPRAAALGGELRVEADDDMPEVFVDDGQLVQVLVVLLNNALDATGQPSRVLLRAHHARLPDTRGSKSEPPPSGFVRFEVYDDGPGIPPENVARIFDPFFTTKASGTGLGLSIAQQLVTENGGRMEVTSAAGGPTAFAVLVPVAGYEPGASP